MSSPAKVKHYGYACLYSDEKNILVCLKNSVGYWFENRIVGHNTTGNALKNANMHCFPGCEVDEEDEDEDIIKSAVDEFCKETGMTENELNIIDRPAFKRWKFPKHHVSVCFIKVSDTDLTEHAGKISTTLDLVRTDDIPRAVAGRPETKLNPLPHVASNELKSVAVLSYDVARETFVADHIVNNWFLIALDVRINNNLTLLCFS
jgi:hypothetical protein